ncbi:MAG: late competence development ComFB family protein [Cyanobacteria bacterium P01_A01_bin.3]
MMSARNIPPTNMVNVLEELVICEAKRQIDALPEIQKKKLALAEVAAYVLNQMSPMYATTRDGWAHQREKALRQVGREVQQQVRKAIVKMRTSPARMGKPLPEAVEARSSLNQLRVMLKQPELSWMDIPKVVEDLLSRAGQAV